jgi:hypothetical protein
VFVVFGTGALFFPEEVLAYHKAMTLSQPNFFEETGQTVDEYLEIINVYTTTCGYTSYLICIILLMAYYYFFYLSIEYHAIHVLQ